MQSQLIDAQREVSTGRHADVGLTLGHRTGHAISLRDEHSRLNTMVDTNSFVTTRLETTQDALGGILESAESFVASLVGAANSNDGPRVLQEQARQSMSALADMLNTSIGGAHLFSGINTDVKVLEDYFSDPAPASRTAVAASFSAAFGVSQDDPAVSNITSADMETFINGDFANLFTEAGWTTSWSSASSQSTRSRIASNELVETSINGNEQAFRKLASGFTMIADLGGANLNKNTFQALATNAIEVIGNAIQDITYLQARVGTIEEHVSNASKRMNIQADLIAKDVRALESVDPYEASTRINSLVTQIETSYALTARLQRLNLLNFI